MQSSFTWKGGCARFAAGLLIMLVAANLLAQTENKKSGPPAKSAAPSRSAPPAPSRSGPPPSFSHSQSSSGGMHPAQPAGNPGHRGPAPNNPATAHTAPNRPATTPPAPVANRPATAHVVPTSATAPHANVVRDTDATNPHRPEMDNRPGPHAVNTGILGRPAPRGAQQFQLRNGSAVQRRPDGRVSDMHDARRGMNVHHGIYGNTRVVVERPDHSRVFAERGRPGYVQRAYVHNGHEYARRTYYYQGRAYDRYYRGYPYHGVYMQVYAPVRYYPVGFYGWAYRPWYRPVVYSWGWNRSPWYGYYGGYFTPYPVYPTASLWLTDYIISSELASAYQARQEAQIQMDQEAAPAPTAAPLTPEVKQMIADEVKNQLALENTEAQQNARHQELDPSASSIATLLSDGKTHVFVAGSSLDVVDAAGSECALSDGDALQLATPPPASATSADLVVLSSKGGRECPKADTVSVSLSDLQEMQNHMRETIDQGLEELQAKQGTGGLPTAPPSANAPPVDAPVAQDAPPPDPNGDAEVNQQLAEADQAEKDVVGEAQQETATAAVPAPITIARGQSIEEVTNNFGAPLTVIDLGSKKIYNYKDMKVTFKNGKVSDVE